MTQTAMYKKIVALEREVQKMKLEAFRTLPKSKRPPAAYSEKALTRAVRKTRGGIWRRDYAKKVKGVS